MDKLSISRRTELFLEINKINLFLCPINRGLEIVILGHRDYIAQMFDMVSSMVVADNPEFDGCVFLTASYRNDEIDMEKEASLLNHSCLIHLNGPTKDRHFARSYYTLYKGYPPSRQRILYGSTYYIPDNAD